MELERLKAEADLYWFYGPGISAFERSTFGNMLERVEALAFDSEGNRIRFAAAEPMYVHIEDAGGGREELVLPDPPVYVRKGARSREASYTPDHGALVRYASVTRVCSRQRPIMKGDSAGHGIHRQLPKLHVYEGCDAMGGIHAPTLGGARRPQMTSAGQGVHLPSLGNDRGILGVAAPPCEDWFRQLQARLRRVRVACGDWKRVLGPSVLGKGKNVGGRRPCAVFLDPPYSHEFRDPGLYSEDDAAVSEQVREWALEHGDDPELRIALCGYAGEHEMPASWVEYSWKAARGYAAEDNDNRERERIWFSPHCLPLEEQRLLFAGAAS